MSQFDQNHRNAQQQLMIKLWVILSLIILPALLFSGCSRAPDEQQIHEAILQMQEGIENRQRKAVLKHLSADFKAQQSKNAQQMEALMFYYFRKHRNITVYLTNEEIRVTGTRAEVTLNALLTGAENILPQRARNYAVRMRWDKQSDEWQLSRLNWDVIRPLGN